MINSPHGGWDMPVASYDWRFDEFAEGRFSETFDHGHHEWATARYLMGDVERVGAWIDSIDGVLDSPVTRDVEAQARQEIRHLRLRLCREAPYPFEVLPQ